MREPIVVLEDLKRACENFLQGAKDRDKIVKLKSHIEQYRIAIEALKKYGEVK